MPMTQAELDAAKANEILKYFSILAKRNPAMLSQIMTRAGEDTGVLPIMKKAVGWKAIANPQKNWDKLMYTPTHFHKVTDKKTGKERNMTDEEKRKMINNEILLKNIFGDAFTILGGLAPTVGNTIAGQMKGAARNSASDQQRNLYGATISDRAAAAAVPMYQNAGQFLQFMDGIFANRFYQLSAEERAAYLRALMGSEHNNMGVSGMYTDAWRKAGDPIDTTPSAPAGQLGGKPYGN